MKQLLLTLILFFSLHRVYARQISPEAWNQLRDIHAWHVENVDRGKWSPRNANTDVFLEKTLKPYILSLAESKKKAEAERAKAVSDKEKAEAEQAKAESDKEKAEAKQAKAESDKEKAEAKQAKAESDMSIIVYVILAIVIVLLCGFVFLIKSGKKNTVVSVTNDLCCPRCGWEHAPEEKVCKNCKTHF